MYTTGEAGSVVKFVTTSTGTGSAFDDDKARVTLPTATNGSGEIPAGVLLCDVVDKDLTQVHLNHHKREVNVGSKVAILRRGMIVTNKLANVNPSPGAPAYFDAQGLFSTVSTNSTRVGTFLGGKSSDGYVKVSVNLM
ncbi:MAG: hypothetical protein QW303_08480 [Nitrososphaerota archaeon]